MVETTNTGTSTSGTYTAPTIPYCASRLPCGYCYILGRACPMQFATNFPGYDPYKITCTQIGTAYGNTSIGKCAKVCNNKTDLGYCKTTACIRSEYGGDPNYGIGNGA